MKVDNLFLNFKTAKEAVYNGTISYNEEIVKLQKSSVNVRHEYLQNIVTKNSTIYTHCGGMHADEIFASALIMLVRNTIENNVSNSAKYITAEQIKSSVKRIKSIAEVSDSMDKCIVLDLLDGHYDHHHKNQDERKGYPDSILINKEEWKKPIKMATFGALWSDFGNIFDLENVKAPNLNVWEIFLARFILPMDQQDNYGPYYCMSPISKVISNMNSYSDFEKGEEYDNFCELDFKFIEAVKMAYTILRNEIMSVQRLVQAIKDIKESDKISFRNFGLISGGSIENFHTYPLTGIEIVKVPEGERAPSIQMDALN